MFIFIVICCCISVISILICTCIFSMGGVGSSYYFDLDIFGEKTLLGLDDTTVGPSDTLISSMTAAVEDGNQNIKDVLAMKAEAEERRKINCETLGIPKLNCDNDLLIQQCKIHAEEFVDKDIPCTLPAMNTFINKLAAERKAAAEKAEADGKIGLIKRFRLIIEPKQFETGPGYYTDANDEHIRNWGTQWGHHCGETLIDGGLTPVGSGTLTVSVLEGHSIFSQWNTSGFSSLKGSWVTLPENAVSNTLKVGSKLTQKASIKYTGTQFVAASIFIEVETHDKVTWFYNLLGKGNYFKGKNGFTLSDNGPLANDRVYCITEEQGNGTGKFNGVEYEFSLDDHEGTSRSFSLERMNPLLKGYIKTPGITCSNYENKGWMSLPVCATICSSSSDCDFFMSDKKGYCWLAKQNTDKIKDCYRDSNYDCYDKGTGLCKTSEHRKGWPKDQWLSAIHAKSPDLCESGEIYWTNPSWLIHNAYCK